MSKSKALLVLLSVYTALLATCGIEYRIGYVVAAAAAATTTGANTGGRGGGGSQSQQQTCGAGTDQPLCDDPAYGENDDGGAAKEEAAAAATSTSTGAESRHQRRANASKEKAAAAASAPPPSKFKNGDIIELYNADSRDIQIVFPSIVKGRDPEDGGYRVTKTTDGKEVRGLPEKFLHMYVPYSAGDEALCNIGNFKENRPIIVRCTVLRYEPAAARGALVLQGNYDVQVHPTKANEEYVTTLPVWKLQRRYLANPAAA